MSQEVVLENLIKYLDVVSAQYIVQLNHEKEEELKKSNANIKTINAKFNNLTNEHQLYIAKLKKNLHDKGYCVGFSICHAAMDLAGKIDWWESALADLAGWGGNSADLNDPLLLPDAKEELDVSNKPKIITRTDIYNRILNYVLFNFASADESYSDFMPKGIKQSNILDPAAHVIKRHKNHPERKQSYFELLDKDGNIHRIKRNKQISGNFSEKDLESLLDESVISNTICLFRSADHVIRIGYRDSKWILYDPNDNHKETPIFQTFQIENKMDLIDEIVRSLDTHSICIEIASFDEKKEFSFPKYDELLRDSPESLLADRGLHIMAKYSPQNLLSILNNCKESHNESIYSVLITELTEKDLAGVPGLHAIICDAPQALPVLFQLADDSKEGNKLKLAIADALGQKDDDHWTGLHMLAYYSPHSLSKLFDLADESEAGLELRYAIADALFEKEKLNDNTGLAMIAERNPAILSKAIELAFTTNEKQIDWHEYVVKAFASRNKQDTSGWEMIERQGEKYKKEVLKTLFDHMQKLETKSLFDFKGDLENALQSQTSDYRGLCKHQPSFLHPFRGKYGKTSIWKKLHDGTQDILKQREKIDKKVRHN